MNPLPLEELENYKKDMDELEEITFRTKRIMNRWGASYQMQRAFKFKEFLRATREWVDMQVSDAK